MAQHQKIDYTEEGLGQDYWEREFHKIPFPGMELMEVTFFRRVDSVFFEKQLRFKQMAEQFLLMLGSEYEGDLETFAFSPEKIERIKQGKLPENYVVHLKYPFEYGGAITFENMVLMPNFPFHHDIHLYMERQMISEKGLVRPHKLYVPTPVGKIYHPEGGDFSSGGQTNTSQVATNMSAMNFGRGGR